MIKKIFFILAILTPIFTFAQSYTNPYYFLLPYFSNQNFNQNQGFFSNSFQSSSQNIQPFIFSSTGSQYAFIYPSNNGLMVNINGSLTYGPFVEILWYGFSPNGTQYAIVGVSTTTSGVSYSVIVNGRRFDYP